jgi:hypothetical protein
MPPIDTCSDIRRFGFLLLSTDDSPRLTEDLRARIALHDTTGLFGFRGPGTSVPFGSAENCIEYVVVPSWRNPRWFVPNSRRLIPKLGNIIKPHHSAPKISRGFAR